MKSTSINSDNSLKPSNEDSINYNINNFSSLDCVNLKIASKPVKFYKIIPCEKNKIYEYNYVIEKIRSAKQLKSENIILFLKSGASEEIKISNKDDWKLFFENSGKSMMELIDSNNTIKIEYITALSASGSCDSNKTDVTQNSKNDEKLKNLFDDDQVGLQILKSIFSFSLKYDKIKAIIKRNIQTKIPQSENSVQFLDSKNFDFYLQNYFEKTIENFKNISQLKEILLKESQNDDSESEILFDPENEKIMDVPSFCEFYKENEIEILRSKIISESFAEIKK